MEIKEYLKVPELAKLIGGKSEWSIYKKLKNEKHVIHKYVKPNSDPIEIHKLVIQELYEFDLEELEKSGELRHIGMKGQARIGEVECTKKVEERVEKVEKKVEQLSCDIQQGLFEDMPFPYYEKQHNQPKDNPTNVEQQVKGAESEPFYIKVISTLEEQLKAQQKEIDLKNEQIGNLQQIISQQQQLSALDKQKILELESGTSRPQGFISKLKQLFAIEK